MHSQDSLFSCAEMSKRPTIKEEGQGGEPEKKLCHGLGFDKFGQKQLFFNFHFNVVPDVPFFSKRPCHKTKCSVSQNFTMQNLIDTCKDACNFNVRHGFLREGTELKSIIKIDGDRY